MLHAQAMLDAVRHAARAVSCTSDVLLFVPHARENIDASLGLDLMVIKDQVDDKTAEFLKISRPWAC